MPQFIAIALIGGLVYFAWRALKREMRRVGDELEHHERGSAERKATILRQDEDGIYRPRKDD
jgi:hypothetical protein